MISPGSENGVVKNLARRGLALALLSLLLTGGDSRLEASHDRPVLQGLFIDNFILSEPPKPAPSANFSRLDGTPASLADYWGRAVLLNFWATWCAPCIREMPSLERLQRDLGPEGLVVLAISTDRGGAGQVRPFLDRLGLKAMTIGLDPRGRSARSFVVPGLPTTYLIDPEGRMVGAMAGPAEWDGRDAVALIRAVLPHGGGDSNQQTTESPDALPADCGCRLGKIMEAKKKRARLKEAD